MLLRPKLSIKIFKLTLMSSNTLREVSAKEASTWTSLTFATTVCNLNKPKFTYAVDSLLLSMGLHIQFR